MKCMHCIFSCPVGVGFKCDLANYELARQKACESAIKDMMEYNKIRNAGKGFDKGLTNKE